MTREIIPDCVTFSSIKIFSILLCGTFITQRIHAEIQSIIVAIERDMTQQNENCLL